MLLLLNAGFIREKQQKTQSTDLEAITLTITQPGDSANHYTTGDNANHYTTGSVPKNTYLIITVFIN